MKIRAKRLLSPAGWLNDAIVYVEGETIQSIERSGSFDLDCDYLAPGLFDTHNHGGNGYDPSNHSMEALEGFLLAMAKSNVTDMLMTVATGDADALRADLGFLREAMKLQSENSLRGARIQGIHMEGPFLNPEVPGAMDPEKMLLPEVDRFESLFGEYKDIIRLVTLAPERPGAMELTAHLRRQNISVQAGHTASDYDTAMEAFGRGVSSVCHTFNAALGIHHRQPNLLTAALLTEDVYCEAICDLLHLHPAIIRLIYQNKGRDRMIIISDSTMPAGLPDGEYIASNHAVIIKDGVRRSRNGALSGGVCYLDASVRNLISIGILPADALYMTSTTPAKRFGLSALGEIAPGKAAHLAAFGGDFSTAFSLIGEARYPAGDGKGE